MNTLEEYLRKEGILEKFLKNVKLINADYVTLAGAFDWGNTKEGFDFWSHHGNRSNNAKVAFTRIKELIIPRFRGEV